MSVEDNLIFRGYKNTVKFDLTLRTRAYALCPRAGTVKTGSQNRSQT